jgi:ParB family chromosome partitioning protein
MVERGELTEGHARAVLAVPGQDDRRALASLIVRRGLSVRAAEQAARWGGARQRPRKRSSSVDPALAQRVKSSVELLLGKPATVSRGKIGIAFADEEELAELAEALEAAAGAA